MTTDAVRPQVAGPWLTDVVADFNTMCAMVSWTSPAASGSSEHVLDQATIGVIGLAAT